MKSKEISKIINNFINEKGFSILIDGPWGCGKTYQIREFFRCLKKEKRKKLKIHYISLFGIEEINQIKMEVFKVTHPARYYFKIWVYYLLNLASKALSFIPSFNQYCNTIERIGYEIRDSNYKTKKVSRNSIYIFDDLERVDDKMSYISLMGYINSLILNNSGVVCVCSSKNISCNKTDDFNDFKEKVFDKYYMIDETDEEIVRGYFEKHHINNIDSIKNEFGNNLRQAQKTAFFFGEIKDYAHRKKYDLSSKITDLQLIRSCNQVVKICFSYNKKYQDNNESLNGVSDEFMKEIEKKEYIGNSNLFGENIANGFETIFREKHSSSLFIINNEYSKEIIKSLLYIFLFNNFEVFNNFFEEKKDMISEENFLDNNLFLLADNGRKKYINLFLDELKKSNFEFDNKNVENFLSILRYSKYNFSKSERTRILNCLFMPAIEGKENPIEIRETIVTKMKTINGGNLENLNQWVKYIREKELIVSEINYRDCLKKSFISKEFSKLKDIFESLDAFEAKDKINSFIEKNNFFLPDLSKDTSISEWSYAHAMANYLGRNGMSSKFKEYAVNICKKYPYKISLADKFEALIHYNMDSSFDFKRELKESTTKN